MHGWSPRCKHIYASTPVPWRPSSQFAMLAGCASNSKLSRLLRAKWAHGLPTPVAVHSAFIHSSASSPDARLASRRLRTTTAHELPGGWLLGAHANERSHGPYHVVRGISKGPRVTWSRVAPLVRRWWVQRTFSHRDTRLFAKLSSANGDAFTLASATTVVAAITAFSDCTIFPASAAVSSCVRHGGVCVLSRQAAAVQRAAAHSVCRSGSRPMHTAGDIVSTQSTHCRRTVVRASSSQPRADGGAR